MDVPRPYEEMDRYRAIYSSYLAGKTLNEVGRKFGIGRSRVHQIVSGFDPDGSARAARRFRKQEEQFARDLRELEARAAAASPCKVCGSWVLRRAGAITCSSGCAKVWTTSSARYILDPQFREEQRVRTARYRLKDPLRRPAAEVRYAQRLLAGESKKGRRWHIPGGKAAKAVRSVSPDKLPRAAKEA